VAFTKTPEQSTYKTQRFNLVGSPQQRSGTSTKDQRFINMFPELVKSEITQGKKYYLKKRPGTTLHTTPATSGEGRGAYLFNGSLFTAVGNQLLRDNIAILTLSNSTGMVGFTEGDGTYKYLFVCDGTTGYVIKTDWTVTTISSVDFPTPHIPTPIFLDGYIFLAKSNTGDIYNSNLEDPLTWTAGDFITAEMYPDNIIALAKNNNYICAFGSNNVEYFYDNANATASPLTRNPSAVLQMGAVAVGAVLQTEQEMIFIGSTNKGGKSIWSVAGFKATEIGTEAVRQSLDAEGSSISNAVMLHLRCMGHNWLVINLTSRTWVYDLEEKLWHEWQYNGGVFPFNYSANNTSSAPYLINKTTGYVVTMNQSLYQDVAAVTYPIDCSIVTVKIDFDSFNRKFCNRFSLLGDVPNDSAATTVYISFSDDDYKTFSTEVSLQFNNEMATLHQQGSFRRRAYKIRFTDNYPLRLEGIELDVNIGQS
jgi:hypothetical protein